MRRSLGNRDGTAVFHLDSGFLCLTGDSADEFKAIIAAMPRDLDAATAAIQSGQAEQAITFLVRHCHEFIHYHQFVGTQFGLVYRRLIAAKARVREALLQDIGPQPYRQLMDQGNERGALLEVVDADRLSLHPIVREFADPRMIELLGWLETFDAYLLEGRFSDLFGAAGRVQAILQACVITGRQGLADLDEILKELASAPAPRPEPQEYPSGLLSICEAQATINELALLRGRSGRELEAKQRRWHDSLYWAIPKRFGWSASVTPEALPRISAAVLLATDIALDGIASPSLHAGDIGRLVLHPSRTIDALVSSYDSWRHILDRPLESWHREDFLERRAYAISASADLSNADSFEIPIGRPEDGDARKEHPAVQYLGLFAGLQRRIASVRAADPTASLYPCGVIHERSETFMGQSEHLQNLICPFLAVGGVPFRNHIDEETWTRWQLLSGYEIWLDNVFGGWGENFAHLPGDPDLLNTIRDIAKYRIEGAHSA